jgi:predicted O-methyltransferase YrrM
MQRDKRFEVGSASSSDQYEFTVDWFSPQSGPWPALLSRIKPTRILEIGSYEGRSTTFLIEHCSLDQPFEIVCIDTWEGSFEHSKGTMNEVERRFDRNISIAQLRIRHEVLVRKLKKKSMKALAELISHDEAAFDLIYIDGSHQATDVLQDAILSFQLLRVGGLLIFDDYLWRLEPDGQQDPFNMPKPAIDAFVNVFQRKLRVLDGLPNWQLYVEKTFV